MEGLTEKSSNRHIPTCEPLGLPAPTERSGE